MQITNDSAEEVQMLTSDGTDEAWNEIRAMPPTILTDGG